MDATVASDTGLSVVLNEVDDNMLFQEANLHSHHRQSARGMQSRDVADIRVKSDTGKSHVQLWLDTRPLRDILGNLGGHIAGSAWTDPITTADVTGWDAEAQLGVDEMAAFLSEPLEEDLVRLDPKLVDTSTASLNAIGMEATIQGAISALKWSGCPREEIAKTLHDFDLLPTLLDVLENGQRCFMVPNFHPNGGRGFRQSTSYRDGAAACNTALNTLANEGRVLLFRKKDIPSHVMRSLHLNSIIRAVKHGSSLGRTCLNLSYSNPRSSALSVNDGTDLNRSDALYVPPNLPTLHSVSGDIERLKANSPGEKIFGGTADVNQAYCQNVASVNSAKLRCTLMRRDPGIPMKVVGSRG
jgi:hypothetical protein